MKSVKCSSAATIKKFIIDILNGTSLGIVLILIPSALVSQSLLLFSGNEIATQIAFMTTLIQSALPLVAGFAVGQILKLTVIDSGAIALAMVVSAGVVKSTASGTIISGSGVMLNILFVAFLASILVKITEKSFGYFKILLQPLFVVVIAGGIGLMTLQPISVLQTLIGDGVAYAAELTPLVMGAALGVIFAFLIVSPLSSVGMRWLFAWQELDQVLLMQESQWQVLH